MRTSQSKFLSQPQAETSALHDFAILQRPASTATGHGLAQGFQEQRSIIPITYIQVAGGTFRLDTKAYNLAMLSPGSSSRQRT